jgi:hypothetical protein
MKNKNLILPILLVLAVTLSCKLLGRKDSGGLSSDQLSKIAASLPTYDPKAPPPSPGAAALRRLAELEPSAATLEHDVEAVERAALKTLLAQFRVRVNSGNRDEQASSASRLDRPRVVPVVAVASIAQSSSSFTALLFLQGQAEAYAASTGDASLVSGLVSGLSDIFAESLTEKGGAVNKSMTETKDGITTTMRAELGRGTDDATTFGIGIKTEGKKNGVAVKTDLDAKLDGQRCPNAAGQVSFTIRVRLAAQLGESVYNQELTAFVRAVVNDDAQIASSTIEVTQGTRQVKGGRQVYVETGQTYSDDETNISVSNFRVIRASQEATAKDQPLSDNGLASAYSVGLTSLYIARTNWQDGACTKIEATSPGTVAPGSSTAIPVTVRHRFDGSEVPSKLEAKLSGEASVDPTRLPKTRGTLTYVAPGETGKSATIGLTATSRRGISKLDLNANTGGGSYRIVGGLDDWQTNSTVCDIMKPFTLTGGGITMQVSGGLSGTYTYTGPFNAQGTGTYTISLPDGPGKPGTMTGGGAGQVTGDKVYTGSGTEKYTLTPIEPCK